MSYKYIIWYDMYVNVMKCAKGNIGSRDVVMLENGEDMVIY